ncbi:hypothetical protein KKH05_00820 [Patescibacteria group bacterium]|nr:hypothetical protein [Patescibacteria group bacterium]
MKYKSSKYVLFFGLVVVLASSVNAATFSFDTPIQDLGLGQRIEVKVLLDSGGEALNAVEGLINLSSSILAIDTINDANSIISFWSERPKINEKGTISFAGIIPGGWNESNGFLFSFVITALDEGSPSLTFNNLMALLNDGMGTRTSARGGTINLQINRGTPLVNYINPVNDKTSPEAFDIELSTSTSLFSGDYFIAFSTLDKNSGIDKYEVVETPWRIWNQGRADWTPVESPYRLNDQSLKSYVYVRAIDRAGNWQIAVLPPEKSLFRFLNVIIVLALLVSIVLIVGY